MALFQPKNDPQKRLDAAKSTRTGLIERRTAAEASANELREKARQAARENADDAALSKIEAQMRVQQDRVATLTAAIGDIDADIRETEAEIERIADQKTRAASVAKIDDMIERWKIAEEDFVAAAQQLEAISREVSLLVLDAHGTTSFLMSARSELPPAGRVILEGLRQYSAAVRAGRQRATLPQPEAPPVKLKLVEAAPTREIVPLKHLKFTHEGKVVTCGAYQRCSMPAHLAEKALRDNLAAVIGDKRIADRIGLFGVLKPSAANCIALDDTVDKPTPQRNAPIMASPPEFELMDRGPPITGIMATGTRSLEEKP